MCSAECVHSVFNHCMNLCSFIASGNVFKVQCPFNSCCLIISYILVHLYGKSDELNLYLDFRGKVSLEFTKQILYSIRARIWYPRNVYISWKRSIHNGKSNIYYLFLLLKNNDNKIKKKLAHHYCKCYSARFLVLKMGLWSRRFLTRTNRLICWLYYPSRILPLPQIAVI